MVAHRWFSRPVHSAALPYFRARISLPGTPLNRTRCWVAAGFGLCRAAKRGKSDMRRPKTLLAPPAGRRAGSGQAGERGGGGVGGIPGPGLVLGCAVSDNGGKVTRYGPKRYSTAQNASRWPKTLLAGPNASSSSKPVSRRATLSPARKRARIRPRPGPSIPRCPRPCAGCNRPAPCAAPGPAAAPAG